MENPLLQKILDRQCHSEDLKARMKYWFSLDVTEKIETSHFKAKEGPYACLSTALC